MIPRYTPEEFSAARSSDNLAVECEFCSTIFTITKQRIKDVYNPNKRNKAKFCSLQCQTNAKIKRVIHVCTQCGAKIHKTPSESNQSISGRHFCSSSCAATYNNTHKKTGNRRSKLEKYLETELPILFDTIEFHFNRKNAINSELDIYIPSLRLAFELNGIFHYEPIYGSDKLQQIKNNDHRKFQACIENNIELCIIDASGLKYFKQDRAKIFLDIIVDIIKSKNV
jgi:hypothetical protein